MSSVIRCAACNSLDRLQKPVVMGKGVGSMITMFNSAVLYIVCFLTPADACSVHDNSRLSYDFASTEDCDIRLLVLEDG